MAMSWKEAAMDTNAPPSTSSAHEQDSNGKAAAVPMDVDLPQPANTVDERAAIKKLMDAPMEDGATWYLISYKWWSAWREYVQFTAANYYKGERPGPITNEKLLDAQGNLRLNLLEDYDMVLVPEPVWKRLQKWYSGAPDIPRKVITTGYYIKKKMVEIYQLCIKAVYNAKPGEETEYRFSRLATVKEVKAAVLEKLGIAEKADKVKVFNYFASYKHEELVLEATLDDARITDGQRILFEEEGVEIKSARSAGGYNSSAISSAYSSSYTSSYPSSGYVSAYNSSSSGYGSTYDAEPSSPGLVGLMNLGNTCFMNSGLQCLSHCGLLVDFFLTGDYKSQINRSNKLGMKGQLAEEFATLVTSIWKGKSGVYAPRDFKHVISMYAPQFSGYQQHDSQELLSFVLDGLHEDLNRIVDKPLTPSVESDGRPDAVVAAESWFQYICDFFFSLHKRRNDSVIVDHLQGQYKSHVQCNDCKKVSITFDPFTTLSLPLPSIMQHMSCTVIPWDPSKRPNRYYFLPSKTQLFHYAKELMESVSQQSSIALLHLQFVFVSRREPLKVISGEFQLDSMKSEEFIVAYELPAAPETPAVDTIGVFVLQKAARSAYSYMTEIVDRPLFLQLSRSKTTYKSLYELLWSRLGYLMANYEDEESVKNGTYKIPPANMQRGPFAILGEFVLACVCRISSLLTANVIRAPKPAEIPFEALTSWKLLDLNTMRSTDLLDDPEAPITLKDGQGILVEWTVSNIPKTSLSEARAIAHKPPTGPSGSANVTLADCMELFRWPEPLTTGNEWYCPGCKKHVKAVKTIDIYRAPKILVLQLKRFKLEDRYRDKIDTPVEFPLSGFDLKPYMLSAKETGHEAGDLIYDLFAISNHMGGLGGGHYTAYARVGETWHSFDDSSVDSVNSSTLSHNSSAYVLFYMLRGQPVLPPSIASAVKKDSKDVKSISAVQDKGI